MAKPDTKDERPISPTGRKLTVLEQPVVINRMIIGLALFCALLFLADLAHIRHGKFAVEDLIGFYGFYGFAAFAFIIFATKALRAVIGRDEDYYGDRVVDAEDYPPTELELKEFSDD